MKGGKGKGEEEEGEGRGQGVLHSSSVSYYVSVYLLFIIRSPSNQKCASETGQKLDTSTDDMPHLVAIKAWFPLSQLQPRQRPISSQNKAISVKDDCSTL